MDRTVNWDEYEVLKGVDITECTDPAEYIRKMRDEDRNPWDEE